MRIGRVFRLGFLIGAVSLGVSSVAAAGAIDATTSKSNGNHDLGCRVIAPPGNIPAGGAPLIVWADGWYQGEINGADTTTGYVDGLEQWAANGWFVVATTQWSVRSTDVLRCLTWVLSTDSGYSTRIDASKIGLAGHSQGAGAVLKAADGEATGKAKGPTSPIGSFDITAVIAMNPYGPSFPDLSGVDGPVLLLGGSSDTTTPTESFLEAWESVAIGPGGILAEVEGGTHNSEAWGSPPEGTDFGKYQSISEAWWTAMFTDPSAASVTSVYDIASSLSWWSRLEVSAPS